MAGVLKFAMQVAEVRCIGAALQKDYEVACEYYSGLDKVFQKLHVKPLDGAGAMGALKTRREGLEKFHQVKFADDALECAVQRADGYLA